MMTTSNRLSSIATRQHKGLLRDAIFAAIVAVTALVSVGSVTTAIHAASSHVVVSR
jgi:hypothetical protein